MLQNYLKIALRNLQKHKVYAGINIAGLALGMACGILIFLSVQHDLSYDRFHEKADRIYRVLTIDRALGVSSQRVGITLPALGPVLEQELPEVEQAVRMSGSGRQLFSYGDRDLYAENVFYAEPGFFDLFDFPLLRGDAATALKEPSSVVLTQAMARRLFGAEDALGKTIRTNNEDDLTVTGVVADVPANSHLVFDALISLYPPEGEEGWQQWLSSWNSISMTTYVLLDRPEAAAGLEEKMERIIRANDVGDNFSVTLQPLLDAHLRSSDILYDNNERKSDVGYVYGLAVVAVFVLLIASFNFMNLATARSAERAREVGVRKVVGAHRKQLILQHLGESVLLCLIAFLLALGLVTTVLPFLNTTLERHLSLDVLSNPALLLFLLGLGVAVAFLSGSYPAFVLSRFNPSVVLKGSFKTSPRGSLLRKVLVVTQFAASVVLIVGSLVVSQQLSYIREKNMGYNREQVLVLELNNPQLQENAEALQEALLRHPAVQAAARSSSLPGRTLGRTSIQPEGASEDDIWITSILAVNDQFLPVLGIELAAGRNFSRDFGTDAEKAVLLNEAAARALGWAEPLGRRITVGGQERTVAGIVRDFHFASVRHKVEPLVLLYQPDPPLLSLKIDTDELAATMDFVAATWKQTYPDYPFEYTFLDNEFEQQYREEANFAFLSKGFTLLAILIACLGLFGLASFTAQQRTKEIGVRKVLGASLSQIVLLLSAEFTRLVGLAVLVAVPLAYLAMSRWLEDFAYRIDLGPGTFLLAGFLALVIALLTVSYQSVKAALINPVKALRYE